MNAATKITPADESVTPDRDEKALVCGKSCASNCATHSATAIGRVALPAVPPERYLRNRLKAGVTNKRNATCP
jgi:hypothetical protein